MIPEVILSADFLKQYYGGTPYIPNVVMLQEEIEDVQIISEWLSSMKKRKVSVVTPKKGTKEKTRGAGI